MIPQITYYDNLQWARLCTAFLEEAKWFASGHLPEAEEYLKNGITSSGVHVALVHMFFLIGDGSTKDLAESVKLDTCLISYNVAAILRLWDDLGSAKVKTYLLSSLLYSEEYRLMNSNYKIIG